PVRRLTPPGRTGRPAVHGGFLILQPSEPPVDPGATSEVSPCCPPANALLRSHSAACRGRSAQPIRSELALPHLRNQLDQFFDGDGFDAPVIFEYVYRIASDIGLIRTLIGNESPHERLLLELFHLLICRRDRPGAI